MILVAAGESTVMKKLVIGLLILAIFLSAAPVAAEDGGGGGSDSGGTSAVRIQVHLGHPDRPTRPDPVLPIQVTRWTVPDPIRITHRLGPITYRPVLINPAVLQPIMLQVPIMQVAHRLPTSLQAWEAVRSSHPRTNLPRPLQTPIPA